MDIEQQYQEIIAQLEQGGRALKRFSKDEMEEIKNQLQQELNENNHEKIGKLLCIIEHSASDFQFLEEVLLQVLTRDFPPHLMVFALNCARKHIIQSRFKRGIRLDFQFLEVLKKLLFSKSPEVVEWTLRTIEECGSQGVYFLREFDKIKPPPWKWFNAHERAVREIIAMLERRWSRFEKH